MTDKELRQMCEDVLDKILTFDLPTNEEMGIEQYARDINLLLRFAKQQRAAGVRMAVKLVASGRFLHDEAPDARFAKAVNTLLEAQAKELERE